MTSANASPDPVDATIPVAEQLRARFHSLTPRQREVCRLMVQGMMSKQIADRLGASINTIKTHRTEIFRKMNARSLVDLVHQVDLIDRLPKSALPVPAPPAVPAGRKPLQVLVVEDHPLLRETLASALERLGYGVFAVPDGDAMMQILAAQHFDVVLLDIALGEGHEDGFSLAARLRAQSACGIVMTTASGDVDSRIRGYAGGADAYLVKPVDFQELDAVLQNLSRRLPPP